MSTQSPTLPSVHKGWLLVAVVIIGGALLGLGARAIIATGQGADFDTVLNEPARTADDAADIEWIAGDPLLRTLEPQTIEGIEFAWTRALSAVRDAATTGETIGVDVWFSGPAQDQVHELVATGTILDGGQWDSHEIRPDFYSIDGQILVTTIERTATAPAGAEPVQDRVRAVFILRDGNWRIEHLVRLAEAS